MVTALRKTERKKNFTDMRNSKSKCLNVEGDLAYSENKQISAPEAK